MVASSHFLACGFALASLGLHGCGSGSNTEPGEPSKLVGCVVDKPKVKPQKTFPSIGYLGQSYHIYTGNPKQKGGSDPGFKQPIFQLQYENNRMTADQQYSVPDGTDGIQVHSCSSDASVQKIFGASSYTKSVSTSIDATIGYGAFSASSSYQSVSSSTSSSTKQSVFVEASAKCAVYKVSVQTSNPPQVTKNFANAVGSLPAEYNNDTAHSYFQFIDDWGTHALLGVEMGGMWGQMTEFSKSSYTSMVTSGTSVSAGASASFIISAGISVKTDEQQQAAESFKNSQSSSSLYNTGGEYSDDKDAWVKTVRAQPMPIKYTLRDISDLLDAKFMAGCDAGAMETVKAGLKSALTDYCNQHARTKFPGVTCEKLADDPPPPELRGKYQNVVDVKGCADQPAECADGQFITGINWYYQPQKKGAITDAIVTCSDGESMMLATGTCASKRWGKLQNSDNCSSGYSSVKSRSSGDWGLVNVGYHCKGSQRERWAASAGSQGNEGDWIHCPPDMSVLVGLKTKSWPPPGEGGGYWMGITALSVKCGNSDELQRSKWLDFPLVNGTMVAV